MTILVIILVILALVLIRAYFLTDELVIEKDILINKTAAEVFNYIKFVKNSENYSKWVMMDPNMKKEYKGTDGTVGFVYSWDSTNKNVGKGEQEITKITNNRVDWEIRFIKPFENTSTSYMTTDSVSPTQTKVAWVFQGPRTYFMKLIHFLLNLKKMLGNDLNTGLTNLKSVLEKQ
ncbi:MAG: SRPBCC family protein [Bacteroidota bacterium]